MAISKDIIKKCIIDKRLEIENLNLVERNFSFEENGNYVFVGIRRVGKSYIMYQRIKQLQKKGLGWNKILFLNFEDERLSEMQTEDFNSILECHYESFGTENKPILFFDEIQNVAHWDKFVRRLVDSGYIVYVTGSNANMLSKDVATTLGGRFFIVDVYPFKFDELLKAKKIDIPKEWQFSTIDKSILMKEFNEFLNFGAMPEVTKYTNKRDFVSSLYRKIYLGDICMRNAIRNTKALEILIKKLAENVKQASSLNRIQNIIKNLGYNITVNTVCDYIQYAIDSWLILPIENYLGNFSSREGIKKYYFIDNGLLNLFLSDSQTALLENLVAISLCRKYGVSEVKYVKANFEIDFYIPEIDTAIQVSYSINDNETQERETRSLMEFAQRHPNTKLMIITYDEKKQIEILDKKIEVIPIMEWIINL